MCSEVIGNRRNIEYLEGAAREGRLAHAYIINGEKGSGKKTLAGFIARGLLCEKKRPLSEGPCGSCPACIKTRSGNHPDLVYVKHEKENVLSVGEIRSGLVADIGIKPFYGPYKIYIVEDAGLMTDSAQNALLKTMEEPPEYGIIFLLTENADVLLETVRSRCVRLDTERLTGQQLKARLSAAGADGARTEAAIAFSGGNLGKTLEILSDSAAAKLTNDMAAFLSDIADSDAAALYAQAAKIEKSEQAHALEITEKWFRDVLLLKACEGQDIKLYFPAERTGLKHAAAVMSYEDLDAAFAELANAKRRLKANVKADAVFEVLFLELRKHMRSCA